METKIIRLENSENQLVLKNKEGYFLVDALISPFELIENSIPLKEVLGIFISGGSEKSVRYLERLLVETQAFLFISEKLFNELQLKTNSRIVFLNSGSFSFFGLSVFYLPTNDYMRNYVFRFHELKDKVGYGVNLGNTEKDLEIFFEGVNKIYLEANFDETLLNREKEEHPNSEQFFLEKNNMSNTKAFKLLDELKKNLKEAVLINMSLKYNSRSKIVTVFAPLKDTINIYTIDTLTGTIKKI